MSSIYNFEASYIFHFALILLDPSNDVTLTSSIVNHGKPPVIQSSNLPHVTESFE